MHAGEFADVRVLYEQVERLRLADISAAVGSHINDAALLDFPNCFVKFFNVLRNFGNVLNGTFGGENFIFHGVVPQTEAHKVF